MPDIDLTPMNEAAARALFAEDLAEQCIRRQTEMTAEKKAQARIQFREYALNSWDRETVNGDTVLRFRELALAATLVNWKSVASQALHHATDLLEGHPDQHYWTADGLRHLADEKYGEGRR